MHITAQGVYGERKSRKGKWHMRRGKLKGGIEGKKEGSNWMRDQRQGGEGKCLRKVILSDRREPLTLRGGVR